MFENVLKQTKKYLIPFRATSVEVLFDMAKQQKHLIDTNSKVSLKDIYHLCSTSEQKHLIRCVIKAHSNEDYSEKLNALIAGKNHKEIFMNTSLQENSIKLAFVYSGMGPQKWGMGHQLFKENRIFRNEIEKCNEILKGFTNLSLLKEFTSEEADSEMNFADVIQVSNFALQLGLTAMWKSWGVCPDAIVGHSTGETSAFYEAGVYSLEDAMKINYYRGKLQNKIIGQGKMLALNLPVEEVYKLISKYGDKISIAAINSPFSVTLAGNEAELKDISNTLPHETFKKFLLVDIPYHSQELESIRFDMVYHLRGIKAQVPRLPLYSTVTGEIVDEQQVIDAVYWWKNARQAVLFSNAIANMVNDNYKNFLEIGPHPVLTSFINEIMVDKDVIGNIFYSIRRQKDELFTMENNLCELYCSGANINWNELFPLQVSMYN